MPWELVFFKKNGSRSEAMKLEKLVKKREAERFLYDLKSQSGWRITQGVRVVPTKCRDHPDLN